MNSNVKQVAQEMVLLYMKLMRSLKDRKLSRLNLSASQIVILLTLSDLKTCKVGELAREKGVSVPTATGVIERLRKGGYVSRQRSKTDRREVIVKLTVKGEKAVTVILQIVRRKWEELALCLSEGERKSYIKILKKLVKVIEDKKA
ncbi:MAG: MarR family transcriptional regulator [Candidatus Omnitrophica bacterium]|nr:MarR family transcriptional regulator [Candidatus Omnitrophota bacterium]